MLELLRAESEFFFKDVFLSLDFELVVHGNIVDFGDLFLEVVVFVLQFADTVMLGDVVLVVVLDLVHKGLDLFVEIHNLILQLNISLSFS